MHETAIIQNRFGQLDETVMRAAWPARTEGTNVAGVTLHIDRTPVRLRCQACGVARPEVLVAACRRP
jgi:Zn finger protein HypA/HybF involved in hydrogenase expression